MTSKADSTDRVPVHRTDGQTWLWYRDRLTAARDALDRTPGAPALVNKSLGL
jgi:hypothetical protein